MAARAALQQEELADGDLMLVWATEESHAFTNNVLHDAFPDVRGTTTSRLAEEPFGVPWARHARAWNDMGGTEQPGEAGSVTMSYDVLAVAGQRSRPDCEDRDLRDGIALTDGLLKPTTSAAMMAANLRSNPSAIVPSAKSNQFNGAYHATERIVGARNHWMRMGTTNAGNGSSC